MKKQLFLFFIFPISLVVSAQKQTFITTEIAVNELLNGTLYSPAELQKTKGNYLVILIAGSGPTDRNGNQPTMNMANNSLKFLSEGLAKNGIHAFTYDKRLFALMHRPDFKEADLSFEDFIDDAVAVITYFQQQDQDRSKEEKRKIIVLGHSEGSLIGMIAAQRTNADGFISIAGPGNAIDKILETQIGTSMPTLLDETKSILSELKQGNTVEVKNPFLQSVFRQDVQPYIISWLKYNPQTALQKLSIPIMIVNGSADFQVGVTEAELLRASKPDAVYLIVKNMNHLLKIVKNGEENQRSYNEPTRPVSKKLLKAITSFITTKMN